MAFTLWIIKEKIESPWSQTNVITVLLDVCRGFEVIWRAEWQTHSSLHCLPLDHMAEHIEGLCSKALCQSVSQHLSKLCFSPRAPDWRTGRAFHLLLLFSSFFPLLLIRTIKVRWFIIHFLRAKEKIQWTLVIQH